jgi:hypothetical protein
VRELQAKQRRQEKQESCKFRCVFAANRTLWGCGMPRIYPSGDKIPSIGTRVNGGTTLVIHHPDDVPLVLKFIQSAARSPESPLASVYQTLSDPRVMIDDWLAHFRALEPSLVDQSATSNETGKSPPQISTELPTEEEVEEPTFLKSDLEALLEAIRIAVDVWRFAPPNEQEQIFLVVAVADPTRPRDTPLLVDGNGVAFAITRGSLIAQAVKLPLRAFVFFVGLVTGEGATPAARVEGLVERIRRQAIAEAGPALRNLPPRAVLAAGSRVMVRRITPAERHDRSRSESP